jgi:hypothetical protein
MIGKIKHSIRLVKSVVREKLKSTRRSSKWNDVRDQFLSLNPECVACGYGKNLQVHHVQPFKKSPELELDSNNLTTLCMGPEECHVNLGHADSFKYFNPRIRSDAEEYRNSSKEQRLMILARAKANRLKS